MMIAGRAVSLPGGLLSDRHLPSRRRRGGAAPQPDLRLTRAVAGTLRLVSKTGAMTGGPGKGKDHQYEGRDHNRNSEAGIF